MMQLISPNQQYQQSYNDYINELGNEERYPFPLDFDHSDFPTLLQKLDDYKNGINIPDHAVPSTTLWLVDNSELVGVTNLRHFLNSQIEHCGGHIGLGIRPKYRGKGLGHLLMKLSIEKLNSMGVNPVHIHCYKNNTASAKVIIENGGILDSEITIENTVVQRYLVTSEI